jgi:integral membrane protein
MLEGTSFLVLLCIAMPLKYLSDMPDLGKRVVFWVGLVHGVLFIGYAVVAFWAWRTRHLSGKLLLLAAVASVVPLGPFFIDRRLKTAEQPAPDTAEGRG